jgi:carboxylesterase
VPLLPGAAPYAAGSGGALGVLLCHGFTGTPSSLRPWAEHLAAAGLTVELPLLPGHGTRWQDLNRTTYEDWYAVVEAALHRLGECCERVVVTGLSMGACLALRLAEEHPDAVAGLVLVNPSVARTNRRLLALPLLRRLLPSMPPIGSDIKRPGVVEEAYDRLPLTALASLTKLWLLTAADLSRVQAPLLVFRSREDHVVEAVNTAIILRGVSSVEATERVLEDSYHVATLDNDAEVLFAESLAFARRVGSLAPAGS